MAVGSIVDYLKSQGKDSSYTGRKNMAAQYGIQNYSGTAAQNVNLMNMIKNGGSGNNPNGAANAPTEPTVPAGPASFGYNRPDRVNDYYNKLQEKENHRPGQFESQYGDEISDILDNILNRPDFKYTSNDLMNDDLYKMYRDNYMRQGSMAMRDTMGNAAGLTGGYGNTYASAVGQQAYDNYLGALNDKALEFSDRAYNRYRDNIADNYNQLSAVMGVDNTDYSRYRDDVNDYYTDRDYLNGRYNQEYNYDYGQYKDNMAQQQWAQEFAFKQQQAAQEQSRWEAEMAAKKTASRGGSGGRSYSSGSAKNTGTSKSKRLSVNDAVSILDKIHRSEGVDAAAAEAQRMLKGGLITNEKGDLSSKKRISRMIDQWQYMDKKNKSNPVKDSMDHIFGK